MDIYIFEGRNITISGNSMMIEMQRTAAIKNGHTPLKIVVNGTSGTAPFMTKTFRPTGGVISPTSRTITMMTPNQSGLKFMALMMGNRMGTIRIMIA